MAIIIGVMNGSTEVTEVSPPDYCCIDLQSTKTFLDCRQE